MMHSNGSGWYCFAIDCSSDALRRQSCHRHIKSSQSSAHWWHWWVVWNEMMMITSQSTHNKQQLRRLPANNNVKRYGLCSQRVSTPDHGQLKSEFFNRNFHECIVIGCILWIYRVECQSGVNVPTKSYDKTKANNNKIDKLYKAIFRKYGKTFNWIVLYTFLAKFYVYPP